MAYITRSLTVAVVNQVSQQLPVIALIVDAIPSHYTPTFWQMEDESAAILQRTRKSVSGGLAAVSTSSRNVRVLPLTG